MDKKKVKELIQEVIRSNVGSLEFGNDKHNAPLRRANSLLHDALIELSKSDESGIWYDARKEKQPQGVCDNNVVLVVGLRNGRVAYKHLWADMEDCWKDLDLLAPPSKKVYDKVLWAYVRDLVPGAKGKGE